MLNYTVKYDAETRLMELIGESDLIGTAYDENCAVIQFQIVDVQHRLEGFGGRVDFDILLYDCEAHKEFKPYVVLDENNRAVVTHEIMSAVVSKKLPIQLVWMNGTTNVEYASLNTLILTVNKGIDPVCPKKAKLPNYSVAFYKVAVDEDFGYMKFTSLNGKKTSVKIPGGSGGESTIRLNGKLTKLNQNVSIFAPIQEGQPYQYLSPAQNGREPKWTTPATKVDESKLLLPADVASREFDKVAYIEKKQFVKALMYLLNWGQIGGLLKNQPDLWEALESKQIKLTAVQMKAVNSGITKEKVDDYDTLTFTEVEI